ncbi:MAG: MltA domain-containing protein [Hyphomicrobiaceae bacterium]|nr:MltA domain-containing protein [Hyphomicrobiaceae bacterium]
MTGAHYDPVGFSELPHWESDDHLAALKAFLASCPKIVSLRRSAAAKAGQQRTPQALADVCEAALGLPAKPTRLEARGFFEKHFLAHRVTHAGHEGLLTGYYEPLIEGSRIREGRFQAPILRRPPDLVTVVNETEANPAGKATHARRTAAGLVPFATRAEIDAGALAGQNLELLYLADPVDVFFLQIQGAGRIRLTTGEIVRVQYDGKNGHPYTSIGRYLIDNGLVAADRMSLGALGKWLKADAARARAVMNQNASYVFFREMDATGEGPPGAIEVPLVAGRSIAVDPGVHALGSPIYVSAPTLQPPGHKRPFNRLMVAHDVGAAIKGPERADIYFGSGESAGRIAGSTRHPGNLFVLLAREGSPQPATPAVRGAKANQ